MVSDVNSERVGLFLDEGFPMLSLSGMTDVMRMANYFSGKVLYEWITISKQGTPITSASNLTLIPNASIHDAGKLDRIVVGSEAGFRYDDKIIVAWLRKMEREGVAVGSVATGTWILAKAGLLDHKKCTINPMHWAAFHEMYPSLRLTTDLFDIDGRIFTCAGGTAAIDMFLSFVSLAHGADLAFSVADSFLHGRIRSQHRDQFTDQAKLGLARPEIKAAVKRMEETIEEPISIADLAREIGVSERHFVRLFRSSFGQSPSRYFVTLRLTHAARLLVQTNLPISEISTASGFGSLTRFSTAYRKLFGISPRQERQMVVSGVQQSPIP